VKQCQNLIDKPEERLKALIGTVWCTSIHSSIQQGITEKDMYLTHMKEDKHPLREHPLTQLDLFATTFNNVPLLGTNKVVVPYYPLATAASTDWVAGDGYVMGDSTVEDKEVTIDTIDRGALTEASSADHVYGFVTKLPADNDGKLRYQKHAPYVLA